MPIYEYRCENDHRFELIQKFTDDAVSVCEVCGAPAQRVLHPVAIHFKGSGFYSTDYGRGKKAAGSAEAKADSGSDSKSSSNGGKGGGESKSGGSDSKSGGGAKPAKAAEG
jgi:putative FmdB family regulatory protein